MRLRTRVAATLVVAALATVVWLAIRDVDSRRIHLPDGRQMTINAVTWGTEHRYVHGLPWARVLSPVVPNRWKLRLGIRALAHKTDQPTVMVWAHWRCSRTNSPATYAAVVDTHGTESMSTHFQSSAFFKRTEAITGWNFSNYPRRQRVFGLRLYSALNNPSARLADVPIVNPSRSRAPGFEPLPLPLTKTNDDIEVTLTEFTVGGAMPKRWRLPYWSPAPWNTAAFRIAEKGKVSPNWRMVAFAVSDAAGNYSNCRLDSRTVEPGLIRSRFNDVLWPEETAHKLSVEFVRTARFNSNDLWTVTSVPVPAPGKPVRISPNIELHEIKLTSVELTAASSGPVGVEAVRPNAHLVLRALPVVRGLRPVLSQARDDQGRRVKFDEISLLQNGTLWFALEIPAGARTVDFTFAVTRAYFVDFVAQPTRPSGVPSGGP